MWHLVNSIWSVDHRFMTFEDGERSFDLICTYEYQDHRSFDVALRLDDETVFICLEPYFRDDLCFKSCEFIVRNQEVRQGYRNILLRAYNDLTNDIIYPSPKNVAIAIATLALRDRCNAQGVSRFDLPFELEKPGPLPVAEPSQAVLDNLFQLHINREADRASA